MRLEVVNVEDDKDNYLVTLKGPLGKLVKIWVPKEDGPDYYNFVWDESNPFGLNMVTNSHYT